jgi:sialic acid synthase SpsE
LIHKTFVISEDGSIHHSSFGNARRLLDGAADFGVDPVKDKL